MSRRLAFAALLCWVSLLYGGDFTMPGGRGRIRPPVPPVRDSFFSWPGPDVNGASDPWPVAGLLNTSAASSIVSTAVVLNRLYAMPFVTNRTVTFNQAPSNPFSFTFVGGVVGGAGGLCKLAIYDSLATSKQRFPNHPLFQTGNIDVSSAGCTAPCFLGANPPTTLVLSPGTVYWFVLWCNTAAAGFQVRCFPNSASWPFDGVNSNLSDFPNAFRETLTFAASFPDPFTATSGYVNLSCVPMLAANFNP